MKSKRNVEILLILSVLFLIPLYKFDATIDYRYLVTTWLFFYLIGSRTINWKKYYRDPVLLTFLLYLAWLFVTSIIDGFLVSKLYLLFFHYEPYSLFASSHILDRLGIWRAVFFVVIVELATSSRKRERIWLMMFLIGTLAVYSFGGLTSYFLNITTNPAEHFSPLNMNYQRAAIFLNLNIPFVLALLLKADNKWIKGALSLIFLTSFVGVFSSQSRAGTATMGMILLVFGIGVLLFHFSWKRVFTLSFLYTSAVVLVLLIPIQDQIQHRYQDETLKKVGTEQQVSIWGERRTLIWPAAWKYIKQRPVVGNPAGTFNIRLANEVGKYYYHPHNMILWILYEGGLIGLFVFMSFAYFLLRKNLKLFLSSEGNNLLSLALVCSFTLNLFMHGITTIVFLSWVVLVIGWSYLAESRTDEKIFSLIKQS